MASTASFSSTYTLNSTTVNGLFVIPASNYTFSYNPTWIPDWKPDGTTLNATSDVQGTWLNGA